jgi:hypothetical protein
VPEEIQKRIAARKAREKKDSAYTYLSPGSYSSSNSPNHAGGQWIAHDPAARQRAERARLARPEASDQEAVAAVEGRLPDRPLLGER